MQNKHNNTITTTKTTVYLDDVEILSKTHLRFDSPQWSEKNFQRKSALLRILRPHPTNCQNIELPLVYRIFSLVLWTKWLI